MSEKRKRSRKIDVFKNSTFSKFDVLKIRRSLVRWFVRSLVRSLVRWFVGSFVRSFVGSLVRWFVRSLRSFFSFVRSFFREQSLRSVCHSLPPTKCISARKGAGAQRVRSLRSGFHHLLPALVGAHAFIHLFALARASGITGNARKSRKTAEKVWFSGSKPALPGRGVASMVIRSGDPCLVRGEGPSLARSGVCARTHLPNASTARDSSTHPPTPARCDRNCAQPRL